MEARLADLILEALDRAIAAHEWETAERLLQAMECLCRAPADAGRLDEAYRRIARRTPRTH